MNALAMESLVPPVVVNGTLKKIRALMVELQNSGGVLQPAAARKTACGALAVPIFPLDAADKLGVGSMGVSAEVWLQSGAAPEREFRGAIGPGGVSLVLGAGNQTFLGIVDLLDNLFLKGYVVLYKNHELRVGSHSFISELLAELIDDGYVRLLPVSASRETVSHLTTAVDHIHITGGTASAHSILWGDTPAQQASAIAAGTPRVKEMTAELGNVTPVIITPGGAWRARDVEHHAKHLAQMVAANASCNCLSPKVLILSHGWEHTPLFLQTLKDELSEQPLWPAYYPGTEERYKAYSAAYPSAQVIHSKPGVKARADGSYTAAPHDRPLPAPLPWLVVELDGTDVSDTEYALRNEAFSPCLAVVTLPPADPAAFLEAAATLCRTKVWGSLVVSVYIHPDIEKANPLLLEETIPKLQYGSVVVNAMGPVGYMVEQAVWGAYPGEKLDSLESGIGHVKNIQCLKYPLHSVVRSPFLCGLHVTRGQEMNPSVAAALAYVLVRPCLRTVSTFVVALAGLAVTRLGQGLVRLPHAVGKMIAFPRRGDV